MSFLATEKTEFKLIFFFKKEKHIVIYPQQLNRGQLSWLGQLTAELPNITWMMGQTLIYIHGCMNYMMLTHRNDNVCRTSILLY